MKDPIWFSLLKMLGFKEKRYKNVPSGPFGERKRCWVDVKVIPKDVQWLVIESNLPYISYDGKNFKPYGWVPPTPDIDEFTVHFRCITDPIKEE